MTVPPQDVESVRPDPNSFEKAADFGAALAALREQRGLSVRQLSKLAEIPPATIGGYMIGRHLPPVTQPQVLDSLLSALQIEESDRDAWRAALLRLRRMPGRARSTTAPYRGLASYDSEGTVPYVGREEETRAILDLIRQLADYDAPGPHCIAVVGPSGCGKSSLIAAGVAPRAREAGLNVGTLDPTSATWADDLERLFADGIGLVVLDHCEQLLTDTEMEPPARERLGNLARLAGMSGVVVIVGLRADFYDRALLEPKLLPLLKHQIPVGPMTTSQLRRIITEPSATVSATLDPAFADVVIADLGAENGSEAVVLPLLSHALLMTWEQSGNRGLTIEAYRAVGGVGGAVRASAETAYLALDEERRRTARRLFRMMMLRDSDGRTIRRSIAYADIESDSTLVDVAEAFVAARILTASESAYAIAHESTVGTWPRLADWLDQDEHEGRTRRLIATAASNWQEHGRAPEGLLRGAFLASARELSDTSSLTVTERDLVTSSIAAANEHERHQRRRVRTLRLIAALAVALALVASALAVVLAKSRSDADSARDQALSRQVAARARLLAQTDPALAAQLAVAAYRIDPTVEARSALLEATGDRMVTRILGPEGPMRAVASPSGSLLAVVTADGAMRIFRTGATPALLSTTQVSTGQLYGLAWSPNGRTVVIGSSVGELKAYDVASPASPRLLSSAALGASSGVENIAFTPDGSTMYAATGAPDVVRWQVSPADAKPVVVAKDFGGQVNDVAVAADGRVATASSDGKVRIFQPHGTGLTPTGSILVDTPTDFVYAVRFSPDGRYLAEGSKHAEARVYDVTGPTPRLVRTLGGFTAWVGALAFSPDGRHLTAGDTGSLVQTWQVGSWLKEGSFSVPTAITSIAYDPTGAALTVGTLGGTTLVTSAGVPHPSIGTDTIWNFDASPDGRSAFIGSGGDSHTTPVTDLSDPFVPTVAGSLTGPATAGGPDGSVSASPDGRWVASGTALGNVLLWRQGASRTAPIILKASPQLVEATRFSHDSKTLAATADDGNATLIDVSGATPRVIRRLGIKGFAFGAAFSPDDSLVAVAGTDTSVSIFRAATGERIASFGNFASYVYGVAFSPDGRYLAVAGVDKLVHLWNVTDPTHPREVGTPGVGPTDTIFSLAWSSDSRQVMGASKDGSVDIWSVDGSGATAYASLGNLGASARYAAWIPGGNILAVGTNGAVGAWSGDPSRATSRVCGRAGSPVTTAEWAQYVPGVAYFNPCA